MAASSGSRAIGMDRNRPGHLVRADQGTWSQWEGRHNRLRAALDNALRRGMAGATGPVERGDVGTVREHLAALGRSLPEALAAYREMSLAGASIAWVRVVWVCRPAAQPVDPHEGCLRGHLRVFQKVQRWRECAVWVGAMWSGARESGVRRGQWGDEGLLGLAVRAKRVQ